MLLLEGIALGVLGGLASGGSLDNLRAASLTGERAFLAALFSFLVWPAIGAASGVGQPEFIQVWLLVACVLCGLALANSRYLGMSLAALGLAANIAVIAVNGAMPVDLSVVRHDVTAAQERVGESKLHESADKGTVLLWLGDVIYVPGPSWQRSVVSVGDVILAVGAGLAVLQMIREKPEQRELRARG